MAYKKDQGRLARMVAFWSLAILLFYGCTRLHGLLTTKQGLGDAIGGITIPVLGLDLSPALLIAGAVLAAGLFLLNRWQQSPKIAETLIETESELKKVTWPTVPEAINASIVVLVTVLFLMAFLAGSDWILGRAFSKWLIG